MDGIRVGERLRLLKFLAQVQVGALALESSIVNHRSVEICGALRQEVECNDWNFSTMSTDLFLIVLFNSQCFCVQFVFI